MSWGVHDYPDPPNETNPWPVCERCNNYIDEILFRVDGEDVCEDCFRNYIQDMNLTDLADELDIRYEFLT